MSFNGHRHLNSADHSAILIEKMYEHGQALSRIETRLESGTEMHRYMIGRLDRQDTHLLAQGRVLADVRSEVATLKARPQYVPRSRPLTAADVAIVLKEFWPYVLLAAAAAAKIVGSDLGIALTGGGS